MVGAAGRPPSVRMAHLRTSVTIMAPAARVWAVVSSPEVMALHCAPEGRITPKITQVDVTAHGEQFDLAQGKLVGPVRPVGQGMTWRLSGEFRGKPYWAEHRCVTWEDGPGKSRFAYAIVQDSLGAHERMRDQVETYELVDLGDGTTRVTRNSTFRLRGVILRLLFPLFFKPAMANLQLASLYKLKAYVEGKPLP
ncbi:MAG: SRPBCC family protein [Chloroflexi bacterium]|nr:SRPBCC family protein [Chloroflexota bacterium]